MTDIKKVLAIAQSDTRVEYSVVFEEAELSWYDFTDPRVKKPVKKYMTLFCMFVNVCFYSVLITQYRNPKKKNKQNKTKNQEKEQKPKPKKKPKRKQQVFKIMGNTKGPVLKNISFNKNKREPFCLLSFAFVYVFMGW